MPLDSPEAYQKLGLHLREIDPIIDDFCRKEGFARETTSVSRYPMRRVILSRDVEWWIELRPFGERERRSIRGVLSGCSSLARWRRLG
jgi:hypothetical protein